MGDRALQGDAIAETEDARPLGHQLYSVEWLLSVAVNNLIWKLSSGLGVGRELAVQCSSHPRVSCSSFCRVEMKVCCEAQCCKLK